MVDHVWPMARQQGTALCEAGDLAAAGWLALQSCVARYVPGRAAFWTYARPFVRAAFRRERQCMTGPRAEMLALDETTEPATTEEPAGLNALLEQAVPDATDRALVIGRLVEERPLAELAEECSLTENEAKERLLAATLALAHVLPS